MPVKAVSNFFTGALTARLIVKRIFTIFLRRKRLLYKSVLIPKVNALLKKLVRKFQLSRLHTLQLDRYFTSP